MKSAILIVLLFFCYMAISLNSAFGEVKNNPNNTQTIFLKNKPVKKPVGGAAPITTLPKNKSGNSCSINKCTIK